MQSNVMFLTTVFMLMVDDFFSTVMELSVNETELCVSVEASTIRLPPVTVRNSSEVHVMLCCLIMI